MSDLSIELHSGPFNVGPSAHGIKNPAAVNVRKAANGASLSKDEAVLARFGKKQQLKRRFKYLSSVGLTCTLLLSWLSVIGTLQIGLPNGGPAGLVWGFLGAFAGAMLQALVMGEIASMIPLAGGAFNWVAVLAPPKYRRFGSYIAGWLTVITYQVFVLAVAYGCASATQGLVSLTIPSYTPQLWHATLISYAVVIFGFFVNTYLGRVLPQIESLQLILFVLGYCGILIPLIYLSPKRSTADLFTTFLNLNGWQNDGLAFLVGWLATFGVFIGVDGSDHIAEEIQSAPKVIPFAMWFSTLLNGILAFGMLIAILFVTQDFTAAAETSDNFAFTEIVQTGLNSTNGAAAVISVTVVINILSISSVIATASRALWAFSRENGMPFSPFLAKLDKETRIPFNAIYVTIAVEMVLALISVGSSKAFAAFFSVQLAMYQTTFLIAAVVMLYKRLTASKELPWGPFRLGRFGTPITVVAIAYTVVTLFFSFFPTILPVTPQNMNYSSLIYGVAIILMLGFWVTHGRRTYVGPVWEFDGEYVRKN